MTKILVIEDEPTVRSEVIEWLQFEGYEVVAASDGIEGVNEAFHHQPDLILCDINMPRLDGYGVLLEVHANPLTTFTPFIFLTARSTYENIREGMALGADDYLTKPFTSRELLQAVNTRLKKRTQQADEHQEQVDLLQQLLAHEREQRLLKAKLVAMYSHDFRSPLFAIITSIHLLQHHGEHNDHAKNMAIMERIEASAHQLLQMLDNMLLISQIESGKLSARFTRIESGAFFEKIVSEFQVIYGETHRITYQSAISQILEADPRLLRHLTDNLISNAIKYSPSGSEVRVLLDSEAPQYLVLRVCDEGIGIPEADLPKLFEPFQRASNVGNVAGTGLGLVITKEVVDIHNGTIAVESQPGSGTTFIIRLPVSSR